jgi:hypothetical protein
MKTGRNLHTQFSWLKLISSPLLHLLFARIESNSTATRKFDVWTASQHRPQFSLQWWQSYWLKQVCAFLTGERRQYHWTHFSR